MTIRKRIYFIFNIIFIIIFAIIILGTIFDNQSQIGSTKTVPLLISSILVGILVLSIYFLFVKRTILKNGEVEEKNINKKKK